MYFIIKNKSNVVYLSVNLYQWIKVDLKYPNSNKYLGVIRQGQV